MVPMFAISSMAWGGARVEAGGSGEEAEGDPWVLQIANHMSVGRYGVDTDLCFFQAKLVAVTMARGGGDIAAVGVLGGACPMTEAASVAWGEIILKICV